MSTAPTPGILVRHSARPKWGLALLAFERGGRRGYQFEDGQLREFKEGFFSLLEPALDLPASESQARRLALKRALSLAGYTPSAPSAGRGRRKAPASHYPFPSQVEVFQHMFPEGFQDPAWSSDYRGAGVKRALKRHRQPARDAACESLSAAALTEGIAGERYEEVVARLRDVLGRTDLVSAKQLAVLQDRDAAWQERFARALQALLHGEGPSEPRFEAFLGVLGDGASWNLATAPAALVFPENHVCVRVSTFKQQAKELAPGLGGSTQPSSALYQRYLALAEAVQTKLIEAGLQPADMLDVYDFMKVTLSPKNRKLSAKKADETDEAKAA